MKRTSAIAVGVVILILIAATASAQKKSGGILDTIIEFIRSLFQKIFGGTQTTTTKATTTKPTTTQPLCSPPYIQVGKDCCKDENKNGICDKDEVTTTTSTTTTTKPTTTTKATTTTEETTTTTTIIKCTSAPYSCGTSQQVRICFDGKSIYQVTDIPICMHPDTPQSECIIKRIGPSVAGHLVGKVEDCEFGCDPTTVTCRPSPT
jgi:hypothetical protein